jgi:hypothetical protein
MVGSCGKPDATGRSSGRLTGRDKKLRSPPRDESWVWQPQSLINSDAWRLRSVNCARLIDFLFVEHDVHAGQENGALKATYGQLSAWGIGRRYIKGAIAEAEFLGLVRTERGGYFGGRTECSLYRLTFYADREGNYPSNEWKARTEEAIKSWRKQRSQNQQSKNRSSVHHHAPDQVHLRALDGGKMEESA